MKFFLCSSSRHEWKIRSCHTAWQSPCTIFFFFHHIQNYHFLTTGKDITASLRLRSTTRITTLTLWGHHYGKQELSEHKHCDNAATNWNSENARSRIVASLRGSVGTGTKEDKSSIVRVWVAGFHHVTVRSRLARVLELTNRLFLWLPNFFSGRGKTRIRWSACTA